MISQIARVYNWTPDYILKELSFQQFFLWYDRAIESETGEPINRDNTTFEEIKSKWEYDEETKKYVLKGSDG